VGLCRRGWLLTPSVGLNAAAFEPCLMRFIVLKRFRVAEAVAGPEACGVAEAVVHCDSRDCALLRTRCNIMSIREQIP
jgi:hypothetical protein